MLKLLYSLKEETQPQYFQTKYFSNHDYKFSNPCLLGSVDSIENMNILSLKYWFLFDPRTNQL